MGATDGTAVGVELGSGSVSGTGSAVGAVSEVASTEAVTAGATSSAKAVTGSAVKSINADSSHASGFFIRFISIVLSEKISI